MAAPSKLLFERFELDLGRYELRRAGGKVRLQPIPMDLLILLTGRAGELVTREEIVERLWPSAADSEHSVNTAVRKLRQALGDGADEPRFVETVVGKGYRFIAEVSRPGVEASPPEPVATPTGGAAPSSRGVPARSVAALAILAVAALTIALRTSPPASVEPMKVSPLTALPGSEQSPAFSPDGNTVAFSWRSEDNARQLIYVKRVGSDAPKQMTSSSGRDSNPSWSPDGRWVAFLRDDAGTVTLKVITAQGDSERRVRELTRPNRFPPAWSPDGNSVVISDTRDAGQPPSLYLVALSTGEATRLTTAPPSGNGDWFAGFFHGRLAFLRNTGSSRASSVFTLETGRDGLALSEPRPLPTGQTDFLTLAWSADGRSLIGASRAGMFRVAADGGPAQSIPIVDAGDLSVSPKLNRLVYSQLVRDTDVVRLPGPGFTDEPKKVIASTRMDGAPDYSPDGQRIAFTSQRTGTDQVWIADGGGEHARQLTFLPGGAAGSPRWSPDGAWIAFDAVQEGNARVLVSPAGGGPPRSLTVGAWNDVRPSWSRDGQWVYFGSDRTGRWEIWKTRLDFSQPVQVTRAGGREAIEDRNGPYLYYTKDRSSTGIWRMPAPGGPEEKVCEEGRQGRWTLGAKGIYFVGDRDEVWLKELPEGRTARVSAVRFDLQSSWGGRRLAVSPGDRWILATALVRSDSDLTLVENFR